MTTKRYTDKDICVARVLNEDDKFMLLEVPKSMDETFTLQQGDKFFTIIFTAGKPWES